MPSSRSVKEGRQAQGVDEAIVWQIAATPLPVTAGTVTVWDETDAQDVTLATVGAGVASVQAGQIVLPLLSGLEAGHVYRVEIQYSDGASTLEPYFEIEAER